MSNQKTFSEDEVVAAFITSDSRTITAIVSDIIQLTSSMLFNMTSSADVEIVKDIAQDALCKLSEKITIGQYVKNNYRGFCALCIKNSIYNYIREQKKVGRPEDMESTVDEENIKRESETAVDAPIKTRLEAISECHDQLNAKCKSLISATIFSEKENRLTLRDAGRLLDVTEANARQIKKRCLMELRKCVINKGFNS